MTPDSSPSKVPLRLVRPPARDPDPPNRRRALNDGNEKGDNKSVNYWRCIACTAGTADGNCGKHPSLCLSG